MVKTTYFTLFIIYQSRFVLNQYNSKIHMVFRNMQSLVIASAQKCMLAGQRAEN